MLRKNKNGRALDSDPGKRSVSARDIISLILLILIIGTVLFIWRNSFCDAVKSTKESDSVTNLLKPILDPFGRFSKEEFSAFVRKLAHFSEFCLLGAELSALRLLRGGRQLFAVPLFFLLTAVIDETIQRYNDRSSSTVDVLIDFAGGLAGILFIFIVSRIIRYIRRKRVS